MGNKTTIKAINGWRAAFAVVIVLFHHGVPALEQLTWAGVTFFFMASGYLLERRHGGAAVTAVGYARFALRRASRFYPLHWLTLAMWLALTAWAGQLVIRPGALLLNGLLLQSWSHVHAVYFSYNSYSWFLSTLLFCYLCFPLLSRAMARWRFRSCLLLVMALAVVDVLVLAGTDVYGRTAAYVFPPMRLMDFVVGMVLCHLLPRASGCQPRAALCELGVLAALAAVMFALWCCPCLVPWSDALVWWLPIAVLIAVAVLCDRHEGPLGRLLVSKPLQWLGNISFEMFMLQGVAALTFNYLIAPLLGHCGIDVYGMLPWFIVPVDVVLAWAVNRLFTRRIAHLITARL